MAVTLDELLPTATAELRQWGLLLRGLVREQGAIALTVKWRGHHGTLVRLTYDRTGGCTLRIGERTLTLPDEWLDGALTTDGSGEPT